MQTRTLGRTGRTVSVIGLGTWQLGADWGEVDEDDALAVLDAARRRRASPSSTPPTSTATAAASSSSAAGSRRTPTRASRSPPRWAAGCRRSPRTTRSTTSAPGPTARARTSASTRSTSCSCTARRPPCTPTTRVYDALDTLVEEGAIAAYGVSVETCDEALAAIARPHVASVQIILNAFRLKPLDEVLPAAARGRRRHHRARAARVAACSRASTRATRRSPRTTTAPTTGTARRSTWARRSRASTTRRACARRPEFAELARQAAPDATAAQVALAWIVQQPGVSSVIPGARNAEQARANAAAGSLRSCRTRFDAAVRELLRPGDPRVGARALVAPRVGADRWEHRASVAERTLGRPAFWQSVANASTALKCIPQA